MIMYAQLCTKFSLDLDSVNKERIYCISIAPRQGTFSCKNLEAVKLQVLSNIQSNPIQ